MSYYVLTEETKKVLGRTLHRILVKEDFTNAQCGKIHAGTLGGLVKSESNIDGDAWVSGDAWVTDNAWVTGNARVSGDARVYGNAWVSGDAQVYGNALVYGNAQVYGNAWVYGDARVSGNAWVYGDARVSGDAHIGQHGYIQATIDYLTIGPIGSRNDYTTFYKTKGHGIWVCCGCFNSSIDDFRKKVIETHGSDRHAKIYLKSIALAEASLK